MTSEYFREFLAEINGLEQVWKSDSENAKWSGGVRIFVSVLKKDGRYEIRTGTEDEAELDKQLSGKGLGSWQEVAPTIQIADNEEKAVEIAQKMIEDKDNWLSENYN